MENAAAPASAGLRRRARRFGKSENLCHKTPYLKLLFLGNSYQATSYPLKQQFPLLNFALSKNAVWFVYAISKFWWNETLNKERPISNNAELWLPTHRVKYHRLFIKEISNAFKNLSTAVAHCLQTVTTVQATSVLTKASVWYEIRVLWAKINNVKSHAMTLAFSLQTDMNQIF